MKLVCTKESVLVKPGPLYPGAAALKAAERCGTVHSLFVFDPPPNASFSLYAAFTVVEAEAVLLTHPEVLFSNHMVEPIGALYSH